MDSMDQAKSEIPNVKWNAKAASNLLKKPVRITSVLVHGRKLYTIADEHGRKGANTQIAALSLALEQLLNEEGSLPPTLYLQMDNSSENHCNAFMQFLELLATRGVFETVECSFLLPGHTHEDIDGRFRGFNHYLTKDPPRSLPDLLRILEKRPRSEDLAPDVRKSGRVVEPPEVHNVQAIPEFTEWLQPNAEPISNFARWRCFRWTRTGETVRFEVKRLASRGEWKECRGVRKVLLRAVPTSPPAMTISVNEKSSIQLFPTWLRENWAALYKSLDRLASDSIFHDPTGEHLDWWKTQAEQAGINVETGEVDEDAARLNNHQVTYPFNFVKGLATQRQYPRPPPPELTPTLDELEDPNDRDGDDLDLPCIGSDGRKERRKVIRFTNPTIPELGHFVLVHCMNEEMESDPDYIGGFSIGKIVHIENACKSIGDRVYWFHWWCPNSDPRSDFVGGVKLHPMFIDRAENDHQNPPFPLLPASNQAFRKFNVPVAENRTARDFVQWVDPAGFDSICGVLDNKFITNGFKLKVAITKFIETCEMEIRRCLK